MKRAIAIMSILVGLSGVAIAETLWVYGVNEQQGWYDADKENSTTDLNKCWAAVSANLINWWQNQYVVPYSHIPTGDAVWQTYRDNSYAVMSNVQVGVDWWWTGDVSELYKEFGMTSFKSDPSYYAGIGVIPNYYRSYNADDYVYHVESSDTNLTSFLQNSLQGEARMGIGLNLTGSLAHGITMWGAEFTDLNTLSALWVTDSDDNILNSTGDMGLFRLSVEYRDGNIYLPDYWYGEVKVDSLTVLDATKTDAWNLERIYIDLPAPLSAVPEPTTATLSILALAALSARRRRN